MFQDPNMEGVIRQALGKPAGNVTDLDVLSLRELYAYDASITNLSGLEWATNLTALHLGGNAISDLTSVQNLSRLDSLFLYNNLISDLSPLTGLTNLRNLDLRWNSATNFSSVLAGLENLTTLYLAGGSVTNLEFLTNLTELTFFGLNNSGVIDLSPIIELTNLTGLDLSYNRFADCTQVGELPGLAELFLSGNSISNLAFVQNLTNLISLTLYSNRVESLSPLAEMTNLNLLRLERNQITNDTVPSSLTSLVELNLSQNSISNVTFLTNLTRLTSLLIYDNFVSDLSPLAGLTNLIHLDLSWNPISNLASDWVGFTNLATLCMNGNSVSNLEFLTNLTYLTTLNLATNNISDVSPLRGLTNIVAVNLRQNLLTDMEPLQDLPQVSQLNIQLNALDLSTNSPGIQAISNLQSRGVTVDYLPQRSSPSILVLTPRTHMHWYIAGNATSQLSFYVSDSGPSSQQLVVTASSLDPNLVTDANLVVAQDGNGWRLNLTPTANQSGTAAVILSATNNVGLGTNLAVPLTVVLPQPVVLEDLNLETTLRRALIKPTGSLTTLDLLTLTDFYAYNANIRSLAGLEWAKNLSYLNLSGNLITNYYIGLSGLTNLSSLYLNGDSISNLSFLANLTLLTKLGLIANGVSDLSPLAGLTNLQSLNLEQNRVADLEPIQNLPQLSYVDLRLNLLDLSTNAPALAIVTNLQARPVTVDYLPQRAPPSIAASAHWYIPANATSALAFGVSDNVPYGSEIVVAATSSEGSLVPDVNLVVSQPAGTYRTLTVTPITNQTGTTTITLTATNDAGLSTNMTVQLTVVAITPQVVVIADPKLETVIRSAVVKPFGVLSTLDLLALTALDASGKNITSLSGLERATNLTILDLSGNSITNLIFLTNLTQLISLKLFDNFIDDLSPLAGLTNLQSLSLEQNRIADLEPIQNLPQLSYVDLRLNLLDLSIDAPALAIVTNLQARPVTVDYLPQSARPSIAASMHWYIPANATSMLSFGVSDNAAYGSEILVVASSSEDSLVTNADLVVSQAAGIYRTLTVTPITNQTGTTTITLTATSDAGLSSSITVQLTVVAMTPQLVVITDPELQTIIRSLLVKPTDNITSLDLLALTVLDASGEDITNLSGLEQATNLTILDLSGNSITNLIFLTNLTQLISLKLFDNFIDDLSPLAGLTNLQSLSLEQNRVADLEPIQNLPQLSYVDLRLNLLELGTNAPAMAVISSLQARAVTVDYLPQRAPPVVHIRANWVVAANTTSWLPFDVSGNAAYGNLIVVTARSSNTNLLPDANLTIGHVPSPISVDWAVFATPITNQTGTTTITLTATNDAGLTSETMILVTVAMPLPLDDEILDGTNVVWLTGGNASWFGQNYISRDGFSAAQSGSIINGQESWLETTVNGPGILTFWWKVSSEEIYDLFEFYVNGVMTTKRISGAVDWRQEVVNISPGMKTIRWRYAKDISDSGGLDAAWLDQVSFTPLSWLELIATPTNGQFQLILHPVLGRMYELQASTNLADWFPLTIVAATNTTMPYLDKSADSFTRFYRLYELVNGSVWFEQPKLVGNELRLLLHSPPGLRFEIQASTDLINWSGLAEVTNTLGTFDYTYVLTTNFPSRYFRALVLP